MKNKINLILALCLATTGLITSCEKQKDGCTDSKATNYNSDATDDDGSCVYCNAKGTLRLSNTSVNTTQEVKIDGINYGLLYPGDTKEYSLAAGSHTFITDGVANGDGCDSPATVIIIACQTESFSCAG